MKKTLPEPTRDPLADHPPTLENCALVLIDRQPGRDRAAPSATRGEIDLNVLALGKLARACDAPVIVSTVGADMGVDQGAADIRSLPQGAAMIFPGALRPDARGNNLIAAAASFTTRNSAWSRLRAPLFVVALCAAAPALSAPLGKSFKDWEVACDNAGDCVAHGYPALADRPPETWVRLSIKAGPKGRPVLDGQAKGVDFAKAKIIDAPADLAGKPPVEQLLAMARKEEKATFASAGAGKAAISLSGLAAALLAIDEAQGRLGTQTALIRKGDKPAAAVAAPKALPRVTPVPTAALGGADEKLLAALAKAQPKSFREECPRQDDAPGSGEAFRLSNELTLVQLYCDSGAYNFMSRFWLVSGADARGARPIAFPSPEGKADATLTNPDYDPKRGVLAFFAKGRGVGDCGVMGEYAWTGARFELASWAQMLECAGVSGENGGWPALWRTRR